MSASNKDDDIGKPCLICTGKNYPNQQRRRIQSKLSPHLNFPLFGIIGRDGPFCSFERGREGWQLGTFSPFFVRTKGFVSIFFCETILYLVILCTVFSLAKTLEEYLVFDQGPFKNSSLPGIVFDTIASDTVAKRPRKRFLDS